MVSSIHRLTGSFLAGSPPIYRSIQSSILCLDYFLVLADQIGIFALHGGFLLQCTSVVRCNHSHTILVKWLFQLCKILLARQFNMLLFTLSCTCNTLSHTKFISKLLAAVQFLGHKTNPLCIIQSFQSGLWI